MRGMRGMRRANAQCPMPNAPFCCVFDLADDPCFDYLCRGAVSAPLLSERCMYCVAACKIGLLRYIFHIDVLIFSE